MALDVLTLGPFVFDDFSVPEKLPFGGRQKLTVHKLPGGSRVVDAMGPDDIERNWTGTLWGQDAFSDALTLDAMRRAGEPLPYSNGVEARTVVIVEFLPLVRKFTCVEYSISLLTVDDSSAGVSGFGGLDDILGADLSFAMGLLS